MENDKMRDALVFRRMESKKKRSRFLQLNIGNPLIQVALALGVFILLVILLGVKLNSRDEVLKPEDVGTIASHDYKATRDFVFNRVDEEATEKVRSDRENSVAPVYTWNTDIHDETLDNISKSFDDIREWSKEQRAIETLSRYTEFGSNTNNVSNIYTVVNQNISYILGEYSIYGKTGQAMRRKWLVGKPATPPVDSYQQTERAIHQKILEYKADFELSLGITLSNSTYEWLVEQEFSEKLETELLQIMDIALGRRIIAEKHEIAALKSVTVLRMHQGSISESLALEELSTISDTESTKELINQMVRSRFGRNMGSLTVSLYQYIEPTFYYNQKATENARRTARSLVADLIVQQKIQRGQTIVSSGHQIEAEHLAIYESMNLNKNEAQNDWQRWLGLGIVVILLMSLLWNPLWNEREGKRHAHRNLAYYVFNIIVYIVALRIWSELASTLENAWNLDYPLLLLFPFAAGAMVMRLVLTRHSAFLYIIAALALSCFVIEVPEILFPYALWCMLSGVFLLENPRSRSLIFRRSLVSGILGALMVVSLYLFQGGTASNSTLLLTGVLALLSGLLSAAIVTIALPIAEGLFGYATSVKLLELSNLEHPALKELFLEAPGTYQHSMMVGSLNEAAAEAIGANAILARVGGYYHDIGKVKNAQYFAENQSGDNPHNRLKPNMSALILKTHEKDGVEIAKKHKLPQDIVDFIGSHHGTSLIEFFYQRAKTTQESVREEDYRYPGPRPQSRETAICMISDMVEAAVRSMPEKSPDRIRFLVHKLINHKFADGQFAECDLTLRDLNDIAEADIRIMNAIYHHRPAYPDQKRDKPKTDSESTKTDNDRVENNHTRSESQTLKAVSPRSLEQSKASLRTEPKESNSKNKSLSQVNKAVTSTNDSNKTEVPKPPKFESKGLPDISDANEKQNKKPNKAVKSVEMPAISKKLLKDSETQDKVASRVLQPSLQSNAVDFSAQELQSLSASTPALDSEAASPTTNTQEENHELRVADLTGALGPHTGELEAVWDETIDDLLQDISKADMPSVLERQELAALDAPLLQEDLATTTNNPENSVLSEDKALSKDENSDAATTAVYAKIPDPHDYNFVPNLDVFKFKD